MVPELFNLSFFLEGLGMMVMVYLAWYVVAYIITHYIQGTFRVIQAETGPYIPNDD
jgi:hypothetical protein